jgi:hypothetical protein
LRRQALLSLADPSATHVVRSGVDESFVTKVGGARAGLVFGPLRFCKRCGHLRASGCSPLSLLTFFAAAKKVSAAPHRGIANRPITKQGKANTAGTTTKPRRRRQPQKPRAKRPIPIYESNTHILEISKKPPYNPKHQARKALQQSPQNREPSRRQRGKKRPHPPHTPCGRRGPNDRRQPAMPITVRQEPRSCRVPSRFSGRQSGPAR